MPKEKSQYFVFLLYPDTLPDNWEIELETLGTAIAVSPLHDKDKSKVEGQEYIKPHYHCIYIAKNPVTADSVRKKVQKVLGQQAIAKVQVCLNVKNAYLYLTHESKDAKAKNKQVYDKQEIKLLNNFDIDRYVSMDSAEKDDLLDRVCEVIAHYELANILELKDFVDRYGPQVGLASMKVVNKVLRSHTGLVRLYFDGAYQTRKNGLKRVEEQIEIGEGENHGRKEGEI
ncbi:replication protein RepB [Streptococcus pneumoniae]|nr:replication protein RepB [Streptococcus pneumoniae]